MIRSLTMAAITGVLLIVGTGCLDDPTDPSLETEFRATLTGAAERPAPVTTTASGSGTVTIDETAQTFTVSVSVSNITTVTMAHIHVGAVDVAGGIALNLLPVPPAVGVFNGTLLLATFNGTGVVGGETFATLVARIRAGTTYINVHTLANGGGEIRGQLAAAN